MAIVTQTWATIGAGTAAAADQNERRLYTAMLDMYGIRGLVYWSDDGTSTGTSLFSATIMPMVVVMAMSRDGSGEFSQEMMAGGMYAQESVPNRYSYLTGFDSILSNLWYTGISNWSPEIGTNQEGESVWPVRRYVLHAMGSK